MDLVFNVQSLDNSRLLLVSCLQPSHSTCQDHNGFTDPCGWKEKGQIRANLMSFTQDLTFRKTLSFV